MTTGTIPGITDPSKLASMAYLIDGVKTVDDLKAAVGFLAGSTDKAEPLSIDEVEYLNQNLGIPGTITGPDGKTYVDFSSFTYDRQSIYGSMTAQVLVETSPGIFQVQTVNLYDNDLQWHAGHGDQCRCLRPGRGRCTRGPALSPRQRAALIVRSQQGMSR